MNASSRPWEAQAMPKKAEQPTGFGGKLKELRQSAGLTQQQLAQRAGFHGFTVAKLEQGLQEPSWPTVLALAGALGVGVEAFVGNGEETAARPGPGRPRKASAEPQQKGKAAGGRKPRGKKAGGE
jgi:transcriptional regulator with XRE-family HTH domain